MEGRTGCCSRCDSLSLVGLMVVPSHCSAFLVWCVSQQGPECLEMMRMCVKCRHATLRTAEGPHGCRHPSS